MNRVLGPPGLAVYTPGPKAGEQCFPGAGALPPGPGSWSPHCDLLGAVISPGRSWSNTQSVSLCPGPRMASTQHLHLGPKTWGCRVCSQSRCSRQCAPGPPPLSPHAPPSSQPPGHRPQVQTSILSKMMTHPGPPLRERRSKGVTSCDTPITAWGPGYALPRSHWSSCPTAPSLAT